MSKSKDISVVVKSQLVEMATQRGLVDSNGKPNVSRMLALVANANLRDTVSDRSLKKSEAGTPSKPKGMMIQINKRIMEAFGLSVQENPDDAEFQEAIALTRAGVERKLNSADIDWNSIDAEEQDRMVKQEVYLFIEKMAKIYNEGSV